MKQGNRKSISVFLWLILSCVFHIVLFRGKLDMNTPIVLRLFFVILAVVITLPLHEIIHCIFMKLFGLRGARIEIAKDPLGLPSLRAVAQGEVWGWKQIVIFLAPFMLLTVVPDLLFFLCDKVHFLFFIMAMCNAAGCCFDVAEVARDINKSRSCRGVNGMKRKKWVIPIAIIGVIIILWFTGIIPKQIAKVSGTNYVNEHFPKMQLEYVGVEWADAYGDYLITFKDLDENTYSCVIGPKYFPISMGQGLFAIESDYAENYK